MFLRIHKSARKKGYEELYAELLLYLPWRDEEHLFYDNEKKSAQEGAICSNDTSFFLRATLNQHVIVRDGTREQWDTLLG